MIPDILSDVKEMLAQEFEQKAEWRALVAGEHPEDLRNESAARGLRELARYVRALPDEDSRLRAIAAAWLSASDVTSTDLMLTSYGFGAGSHRGLPDPDEFLTQYASECSHNQLESAYKDDPDSVRRLIQDDETARDVEAIAYRRKGLTTFQRLLDDPEFFDQQIPQGHRPEAVWQQFLSENAWIVNGSLAVQYFVSWDRTRLEQVVAGSSISGVGKRVDALLRTVGRVRLFAFLEIKHHRAPLLGAKYRSGCWAPSPELVGGVAQVQGTVHRAASDIGHRLADRAPDGSEIPGQFTYLIRPRSFLLIGESREFIGKGGGLNQDKFLSFELYRRHLQEPEIITFDELLGRATGLIGGGPPLVPSILR
jgi:hypothetical protein